jgi:NDP-sugar pyrophosphorylase family protein
MASVNGRPFLEYQIELLRDNGVDDIVLCVGYRGEMIREHFEDGKELGVSIRYSSEGDRLLGPIGALKLAERLLGKRFFVTYGDAFPTLDYRGMMDALREQEELAVMAVYKNDGRLGRRDVVVDDGFVAVYDKMRSSPGMEWTNFGVTAMKKEALSSVKRGRVYDEMSFYGSLVKSRQLRAFEVGERFYEIGSDASLKEFERFIMTGQTRVDSGRVNEQASPGRTARPHRSSRNRISTSNGLLAIARSSSLSFLAKSAGTPICLARARAKQSASEIALPHLYPAAASTRSASGCTVVYPESRRFAILE